MRKTKPTAPRDVAAMAELLRIPNVGPATAGDLLRLGIKNKAGLIGRDPARMYATLCRKDGVRHDPCLLDVFSAIVDFANGAPAQPWWAYTPARKARETQARAT